MQKTDPGKFNSADDVLMVLAFCIISAKDEGANAPNHPATNRLHLWGWTSLNLINKPGMVDSIYFICYKNLQ